MVRTDDIIVYLRLQESNLEFCQNEVRKLEKQIEDITHITDVPIDLNIELNSESYSKDEIISAYNRALKYEGLSHRQGGLIIDTFISFLTKTHKSLE